MKLATMLPVINYIIDTEGVPENLKEICRREIKPTKTEYMRVYMREYSSGLRRLDQKRKLKREKEEQEKSKEDGDNENNQ